MNSYIDNCKKCGAFYKKTKPSHNFCTVVCVLSYKKEHKDDSYKNKKCLVCENVFKSRNEKNIFCSHKCRGINARREDFKCENCNISFRKENVSKFPKYCSQKCFGEAKTKNFKGKVPNHLNPFKVKKECLFCKKEFYVFLHRKNTSSYCSKKCHWADKNTIQTCKTCKKDFYFPKHRKLQYCSLDCASVIIQSISKKEKELRETLKESFDIKNNKQVKVSDKVYNVDILFDNKIIEYYGDYYHCNPKIYKKHYYHKKLKCTAEEKWKKDLEKKKILEQNGYKLLIVWENDYNKNKDKEVERCKAFLMSK